MGRDADKGCNYDKGGNYDDKGLTEYKGYTYAISCTDDKGCYDNAFHEGIKVYFELICKTRLFRFDPFIQLPVNNNTNTYDVK
ncbi:hypothetical protein DPMN_157031 [Dreissena polymorpha]|uniref:Uncharacterized protein n=1 Tax=Dreissena polymorpha TaxID=45954 RepID=A0A9D4EIJ6_DREPO|nr:hypothetical protein DPMN_157031 [Dreissena polymorpha]